MTGRSNRYFKKYIALLLKSSIEAYRKAPKLEFYTYIHMSVLNEFLLYLHKLNFLLFTLKTNIIYTSIMQDHNTHTTNVLFLCTILINN